MDNLSQAAETAIYCFRIQKHLRYIGLQHHNVAAFRVTPRVLATNALREIIFWQHLIVSLPSFSHNLVVLVCSLVAR